MQKRGFRRYWNLLPLAVVLAASWIGIAAADTTSSTHYKATETQFNSGSGLNSCSGSYCGKISIGDNVVGSASSANYKAQFGSNTDNVPLLEVITEAGTQNLGILDSDHTAMATRIIKVRNYLSKGYIIQLAGETPSQGTHALAGINEPSTSHQGAEQFGVNLVANTAPSVGADPIQVPSNQTSFGYVTDDYVTSNLFKYINGDIVAKSDSSSGETDYTISIIINVSNTTPSGKYGGAFSAIVVPIY
jgi:hypothetical protein